MTSYELPPNDAVVGNEASEIQTVAAPLESEFAVGNIESPVQRSPISGGKGQPFVISAAAFRTMTPAESFALAGEMVKDVHNQRVEKENQAVLSAEQNVAEENKLEMASLNAEIAERHAALVEKYGPEENWPQEARKVNDTNKIGWGFAAVAGIGALAGAMGTTDANAGGISTRDIAGIIGSRVTQGIQIETRGINQREQAGVNYENKMEQTDLRIEQGRLRLEQNFTHQENQKNLSYQRELSRAKSDVEAKNIKARQDADWSTFVDSVRSQRQQFEQNANMQREEARMNSDAQVKRQEAQLNAQRRQADVNVLNQGINKLFK